jgi:hypothetical protein
MRLTLLTRPGCGLCDDFIEAFASELPALFEGMAIADVDSRDDWKARFGTVIPVLLDAQGQVICQTFFEAAQVHCGLSRQGYESAAPSHD